MTDVTQLSELSVLKTYATRHGLSDEDAHLAGKYFADLRQAGLDAASKAEGLVPKIMWSPKALAALSGPLSEPLSGLRGALKVFDQSYGKRGSDALPEGEQAQVSALKELGDIIVRIRDAAMTLKTAIERHYAEKSSMPDVFNKVNAVLEDIATSLKEW